MRLPALSEFYGVLFLVYSDNIELRINKNNILFLFLKILSSHLQNNLEFSTSTIPIPSVRAKKPYRDMRHRIRNSELIKNHILDDQQSSKRIKDCYSTTTTQYTIRCFSSPNSFDTSISLQIGLIIKCKGEERKILEKLNLENKNLTIIMSKTVQERDEARAKALINEQILSDSMVREKELLKDFDSKMEELIDQLDQKEYMIQYLQKMQKNAENLLRKYCSKELQVKFFLGQFTKDKICLKDNKITNLVEENEKLKEKLAETQNQFETIKQSFAKLQKEKWHMALRDTKTLDTKVSDSESRELRILFATLSQTLKLQQSNNKLESDQMKNLEKGMNDFLVQFDKLDEDKKELKQKILNLEKYNANLIKLNSILSRKINKQLLSKKQQKMNRSFNNPKANKYFYYKNRDSNTNESKAKISFRLKTILKHSVDSQFSFKKNTLLLSHINQEQTGKDSFGDLSEIIDNVELSNQQAGFIQLLQLSEGIIQYIFHYTQKK